MSRPPGSRPLFSKVVDLVVYVVGVICAVFSGSWLVALPLGGALTVVKFLLFLIGFVLVGYGTVLLWPTRPSEETPAQPSLGPASDRDSSPFESLLERVLAGLGDSYPPSERFSPGFKVFVAGCSVLLVSYLMEAVFLIGVG